MLFTDEFFCAKVFAYLRNSRSAINREHAKPFTAGSAHRSLSNIAYVNFLSNVRAMFWSNLDFREGSQTSKLWTKTRTQETCLWRFSARHYFAKMLFLSRTETTARQTGKKYSKIPKYLIDEVTDTFSPKQSPISPWNSTLLATRQLGQDYRKSGNYLRTGTSPQKNVRVGWLRTLTEGGVEV